MNLGYLEELVLAHLAVVLPCGFKQLPCESADKLAPFLDSAPKIHSRIGVTFTATKCVSSWVLNTFQRHGSGG